MPVKVGFPRGFSGLTDIIENPAYATVLGLILYEDQSLGGTNTIGGGRKTGFVKGMVGSLKRVFKDFM